MNEHTVLVVEDDEDISALLYYNLKNEGYNVLKAYDGEEAIRAIDTSSHLSLVLLDMMLPKIDGSDVLKHIRYEKGLKDLPVIIVSAKTDESDVVTALELGADDYLCKPFSSKILLVKVKSLIKKNKVFSNNLSDTKPEFTYKTLKVNTLKHECFIDGKEIYLTATEFNIITTLINAEGVTFTRPRIAELTKGNEFIATDRTVDVQIATLRKKLGKYANNIKTVWGVGYKWENEESVLKRKSSFILFYCLALQHCLLPLQHMFLFQKQQKMQSLKN